tara:strand:+ start:1880 stop:2503 length:624 start_codon:yes stop_codon:yes gene_type:complete
MESQVPDRFVEIINRTGDDVLSDDNKSAQWDWSHKLVGKVHKEVQIPISDKEEKEFLFNVMKQGCLDYLVHLREINKANGWRRMAGDAVPTLDNIHLTQSWIVSQYAGEFNPWHHHTGDFSAVIYLKLPNGMNEEIAKDFEDHYPASGLIEFCYGDAQDFRSDNIKFMPEVGKLLIFPSWLKHFVYPFQCDGERRSMSFNAHMVVKK